jgi:16S rRNA (cytosine1402-N4)-methyltransferase
MRGKIMNESLHIPVMLNEVIEYLAPTDGKIYVDGTFGAGGYSSAILENSNSIVYAIDRDPTVLEIAEKISKKYGGRLRFLQGCFGNIKELLANQNVNKVDGIILDVGVSSMQLDNRERGFSFMEDAYLDMRMSKEGMDACYLINNTEEEELANIIYQYGGERKSRHIASKICYRREKEPITTTLQLAGIVRSVVGKSSKKIDPATKTFQAIRIYINNELDELTKVLRDSEDLLNNAGKLIVVTFHSLEDSIVKNFISDKTGKSESISRYVPEVKNDKIVSFKSITKKPIIPSEEEIKSNPRSRSAKLRAAQKLEVVL